MKIKCEALPWLFYFVGKEGWDSLDRRATGGAGSEFCSSPIAGSSPQIRYRFGLPPPVERFLSEVRALFQCWTQYGWSSAGVPVLFEFPDDPTQSAETRKSTANVDVLTFAALYLYIIFCYGLFLVLFLYTLGVINNWFCLNEISEITWLNL